MTHRPVTGKNRYAGYEHDHHGTFVHVDVTRS